MSDNNSNSAVLGTLVGAAIGFAAGILLAPASGRETRDVLNDKAGELKDVLNDATEKAVASMKEMREKAEHSMNDDSSDVNEKLDDLQEPRV